MGKEAVEGLLRRRYGRTRLHLRQGDDLERKVAEIVEKDLGDFCWSLDFPPGFVALLLQHGFLPICSRMSGGPSEWLYVLLPKLHRERCVLRQLQDLRVDRGARKRSRRYRLTLDTAFQDVVQGCIAQHGESWLWPPMRVVLSALNAGAGPGPAEAGVAVHSVELWNEGELVAGELGYACGRIYTSLTGFFREDGAGTVQMLALGGLLLRGGVECWDLGMKMEYKAALGTEDLGRSDFVALQRDLRAKGHVRLAAGLAGGAPASELIGEILGARADAATKSEAREAPRKAAGAKRAASEDPSPRAPAAAGEPEAEASGSKQCLVV